MRTINLNIPASSFVDVARRGNYIRLKAAAAAVRIEANSGEVDALIEQGDALNLKRFDTFRVHNTTGADLPIELLVGDDTSADGAKIGGAVAVTLPVVAFSHATVTGSAVSQTLKAANAGRKFLLIQNRDAAINLFVGLDGAAATVAAGVKVAPGASLLLDVCVPSGAIAGICDGAMSGANILIVEG